MKQTTLAEMTGKDIIGHTMKFLFDTGVCKDPSSLNGVRAGYRISGGAAFVLHSVADSFHYIDIDVSREVFKHLLNYDTERKIYLQPKVLGDTRYVLLLNDIFVVHSALGAVQRDNSLIQVNDLNVSSVLALSHEEERWRPSLRAGRDYFLSRLKVRLELLKALGRTSLTSEELIYIEMIDRLDPDFDASEDIATWRRGKMLLDEIIRVSNSNEQFRRIFEFFVQTEETT